MAGGERRGRDVGTAGAVLNAGALHRSRLARVAPAVLLAAAIVGAIAAVLLPAAAGPGTGATTASAAATSFRIESWEATAALRSDGRMFVTERLTYDFDGGPFESRIRSFGRDADQIDDFAAADPAGPLEVIPPEQSISDDWEWKLRRPTSDARVVFTLTYSATDVLGYGSDVTDLEWTAVGTEHPGIGFARLTVTFPTPLPPAPEGVADDDATVLRGFAHGPLDGRVEVSTSTVTATWDDVDAGRFLEVRAVAPATAFTTVGGEPRLADILAEERRRQRADDDARDDRRDGWLLSAALAGITAVGIAALWLVGGREGRSREVQGEYWREPLDDPPAVALTNLRRGTVDEGHVIAGTLVDLAQRGYLRIVGETEERFGPDRTVHRYLWLGKALGPEVRPFERDLLEMVFRGTTETTSEELNDWARSNQTTAKKMLDGISAGVMGEYRARGYADESNGRLVGLLVGICAGVAIAAWLVTERTGHGVGWWGVAIAAALFGVGARPLSSRNQASIEAAAKAEGLKKYLEDFSRLEDAPVGHLILWERYLVFAVALGVSADLVRGLNARLPGLLADPSFGTWYVPVHGGSRFDGFDRIETSGTSLASASTPSNSGNSGGGASGGGGGGFGGGGAGAR